MPSYFAVLDRDTFAVYCWKTLNELLQGLEEKQKSAKAASGMLESSIYSHIKVGIGELAGVVCDVRHAVARAPVLCAESGDEAAAKVDVHDDLRGPTACQHRDDQQREKMRSRHTCWFKSMWSAEQDPELNTNAASGVPHELTSMALLSPRLVPAGAESRDQCHTNTPEYSCCMANTPPPALLRPVPKVLESPDMDTPQPALPLAPLATLQSLWSDEPVI